METIRPLFCALTLFSVVGGIQRFNQRVLRSLSELPGVGPSTAPRVHVLQDRPADIPAGHAVAPFGGSKPAFIAATLKAVRDVDCLLIDHVNLLPVAALAKLARPRLPVLLFAHGVEVWGNQAERPVAFYEPHLLRFAVNRVACVSRYTSAKLGQAFGFPASRISLLPNAVDPIASPVLTDPVLAGEPVVLTVTRLSAAEPYKNVDQIIRAVPRLAAEFPGLTLEIVGDGDSRPALERLAEAEGVADRVRSSGGSRTGTSRLPTVAPASSRFPRPERASGSRISRLGSIGSPSSAAPKAPLRR
jgi:glycosyltransferase involved in cell wall biosynthesis